MKQRDSWKLKELGAKGNLRADSGKKEIVCFIDVEHMVILILEYASGVISQEKHEALRASTHCGMWAGIKIYSPIRELIILFHVLCSQMLPEVLCNPIKTSDCIMAVK